MKYQVIESAFHGRQVRSEHRNLASAMRAAGKGCGGECCCGGPSVQVLVGDAWESVSAYGTYFDGSSEVQA